MISLQLLLVVDSFDIKTDPFSRVSFSIKMTIKDFDAIYQKQSEFPIGEYPRYSLWRHYRGGIYQIIDHVMNESTCEMEIVYRNVDTTGDRKNMPYCYSRPVSKWSEAILIDGQIVNRFTREK